MEKKVLINIGRQFGSGGRDIAAALGERLGIPVYDQELLQLAAERSGFRPAIFRRNDERRRVFNVGGILGGIGGRSSGYASNSIDRTELFRIQSETIRSVAQAGSAIFLGRASNYVLRDMDCLDVFISAPLPARVARVRERLNLTAEEAEKLIAKKDKMRAEYYNFFTLREWGVASGYDLCLDSSLLGDAGSAEFIIDFGRRAGLL